MKIPLMEVIYHALKIIDANLIFPLPFLILTIIAARLIFKPDIISSKSLQIVKWIIVTYAIIALLVMLGGMIFQSERHFFINRATGPYLFAYVMMLFCAYLLPFTLLFRKLAIRPWYLLLIAFLLKVGVYAEIFVIITTSLHRDYVPGNNSFSLYFPSLGFWIIVCQGIISGVLLLSIVSVSKRIWSAYHPS